MPRKIVHTGKLDFSEWNWDLDMLEKGLKAMADGVAETIAESMSDLLYARLRYDKDADEIVVAAELQADDRYEHYVEVQNSLTEEVELTFEFECIGGRNGYLGNNSDARRQLECMSRTFLALHKRVNEVLRKSVPPKKIELGVKPSKWLDKRTLAKREHQRCQLEQQLGVPVPVWPGHRLCMLMNDYFFGGGTIEQLRQASRSALLDIPNFSRVVVDRLGLLLFGEAGWPG
jgi:hypothetical protein